MSKNSAFILAVCVAALACLGIVMLYSTSAYVHDGHNDAYYYIKRQSVYLVIGFVGLHGGDLYRLSLSGRNSGCRCSAWPWCCSGFASCRTSA